MRHHGILQIIGPAAVLLLACAGAPEEAAGPATAAPVTGGLDYPAAYTALSLPQIEGELVDAGRQTISLRDGLSLQVTTAMSVDEARDFYRAALAGAGWEEAPSREMPGMPMAGVQATRDGVRFTATITERPEGGTRVDLSVLEN